MRQNLMGRGARTAHLCTGCGGSFYMNLMGNVYCEGCFSRNFLRKLRRSFGELPRDSDVLVVVEENIQSAVMAHVLRKMSEGRPTRRICYLIRPGSILLSLLSLHDVVFADPPGNSACSFHKEDVLAIAAKNGLSGVLMADHLENTVSKAILSLINAGGVRTALLARTHSLGGTWFANALSRASKKEVFGYFFLHKEVIPFIPARKYTDALSRATKELLEKVCKRNYGACNNFVEALRKINTG